MSGSPSQELINIASRLWYDLIEQHTTNSRLGSFSVKSTSSLQNFFALSIMNRSMRFNYAFSLNAIISFFCGIEFHLPPPFTLLPSDFLLLGDIGRDSTPVPRRNCNRKLRLQVQDICEKQASAFVLQYCCCPNGYSHLVHRRTSACECRTNNGN